MHDPPAQTVREFVGPDLPPDVVASFAGLAAAMTELQDAFAGAAPDVTTMDSIAADLRAVTSRLLPHQVGAAERFYGRALNLPSRGQTSAPAYVPGNRDSVSGKGTVTFGGYFAGGSDAAHGGSVMTLLDEAMGWLLISDDRPRVRTARMETSFRSVTPVGIPLTVEVHLVREERRKSFVHGTLLNGDEICAEADGLFISLRAGQI